MSAKYARTAVSCEMRCHEASRDFESQDTVVYIEYTIPLRIEHEAAGFSRATPFAKTRAILITISANYCISSLLVASSMV